MPPLSPAGGTFAQGWEWRGGLAPGSGAWRSITAACSHCWVTSFLPSSGHIPIFVDRVWQEEGRAVSVDRRL